MYPADRRRLIVLDDAGELEPRRQTSWEIVTVATRYPTLPAKYNALVDLASDADIFAVWEDDDIYLPWHIEAHVAALADHAWSHPSRVWSLYTGQLDQEPAADRFHAALAVRREALATVGGWPDTPRADFDQQLLRRLAALGPPGDPCQYAPPSYVFRWASTESYHGQAYMRSADDPQWYDRVAAIAGPKGQMLSVWPDLDAETERVYRTVTLA